MSATIPNSLRVFCALSLDDETCTAVHNAISGPREALPTFRWVRTENWHLTLKFFGDIHPSAVDGLGDALAGAASGPIPIALNGMGAFPDLNRPRVLWVGVDDRQGELQALHERVEDACVRLGYERERRAYQPHLTVARTRGRGSAPVVRQMTPLWEVPTHSVILAKLVLYSSDVQEHGRVYRPLREVNLRAAGSST